MNKVLVLIFTAFFATAFNAPLRSETPGGEVQDSLQAIDYSGLSTQFVYQPDTALIVNEGEVRAGVLYDVMNKKIIWQKNMNSAYPIASLTKMMVALLTVEDVKAGKFRWEDNVSWIRASVVGRRRHRTTVYSNANYSLRDVFKAAMIASNNECAEQMARFLSAGNLPETIERMNRRARELGMISTYYGNPTGLPSPHLMFDNAASPTDLLLLTLEMLKYPEVTEIASMGYATIENGKSSSVIRNHNHLTIDYSGEVDGLKTGYTKRAGFCLVATTAKCEHRIISIVLGCRGPQIRNETVRDMFNNYYTSIGLDPLGPNCPNPLLPDPSLAQAGKANGDFTIVKERVKKIHVVKTGENLSLIASKYNCTTAQLKSWNKKMQPAHLIRGQKLLVYAMVSHKVFIQKPANGSEEDDDKPLMSDAEKTNIAIADSAETAKDTDSVANAPAAVVVQKSYIYHTVAPGDTLFNIAQRYQGVTVAELRTLNNITDLKTLKPGMKLKVKIQG